MSKGVLRIPLQLFTPRVRSSTPGGMVEGGFFSSNSPSLALIAADGALKSGSGKEFHGLIQTEFRGSHT